MKSARKQLTDEIRKGFRQVEKKRKRQESRRKIDLKQGIRDLFHGVDNYYHGLYEQMFGVSWAAHIRVKDLFMTIDRLSKRTLEETLYARRILRKAKKR